MDIRGLPNENGITNGAFERQRELSRTDTNEKPGRHRHLQGSPEIAGSESSELVRLAAKLKRTPEIREDEVSRVHERLQSGYYLSREAAEKTASTLLKS